MASSKREGEPKPVGKAPPGPQVASAAWAAHKAREKRNFWVSMAVGAAILGGAGAYWLSLRERPAAPPTAFEKMEAAAKLARDDPAAALGNRGASSGAPLASPQPQMPPPAPLSALSARPASAGGFSAPAPRAVVAMAIAPLAAPTREQLAANPKAASSLAVDKDGFATLPDGRKVKVFPTGKAALARLAPSAPSSIQAAKRAAPPPPPRSSLPLPLPPDPGTEP